MKQMIIDLAGRTEQHLRSGHTYTIDGPIARRGGTITFERTYVNHPTIASARSILMPAHHLWVLFWNGHAGPHSCRCYMHMAHLRDLGTRVLIDDLYLDVVLMADGRWDVLDIDEFRMAVAEGELTQAQVLTALEGLEHACRFVRSAGSVSTAHLENLLISV